MSSKLTVGTAQASPGQVVYGWFDAVGLPTGEADRFPVMIAQGRHDGPTLWVTGSIHGNEHTGMASIHHLMTPELAGDLRGTVVGIPTLNPAGMRIQERRPYYELSDPNRLFPKPLAGPRDPDDVPSAIELAYERLFEVIRDTADFLVDLHNAYIGSIPFSFRDPVFFTEPTKAPSLRTREEAEALQARTGEMLAAFGFSMINEFVTDAYLRNNLHRSVSGAALNTASIPAFTSELGSFLHLDKGVVESTVAGLRNVMRWAGMLAGEMEPITQIPVVNAGYPVRRHLHPRVPEAGIICPLLREGEIFTKGQPIARLVDVWGRPIGPEDGLLRTEFDGWVMCYLSGIMRYVNEAVAMLAVRDDTALVVPYPASN
jgi:predicted deacylase